MPVGATYPGGGAALEKTYTYDAFYNLPLTENDFDGRAITYVVEPGARIDYGTPRTSAW